MAKGRKATPTTLKVLAGNPGRRPLNEAEPQYSSGSEEIPVELSGENNEIARAEWSRAVKLLKDSGVYTEIDRTALLAYAINFQRWRIAEQKMQRDGLFTTTDTGYVMASPEIRASESAWAILKAMMTEFGMTPASRTKIKVEKPKTELDDLDEFAKKAHERGR